MDCLYREWEGEYKAKFHCQKYAKAGTNKKRKAKKIKKDVLLICIQADLENKNKTRY